MKFSHNSRNFLHNLYYLITISSIYRNKINFCKITYYSLMRNSYITIHNFI